MSLLPSMKYPHFDTKIPSSGIPIRFRPYTVGEEKVLLIAYESKDLSQIKLAIKQILSNCIIQGEGMDIDTWPAFDIEFIYLKIRSQSVSNTIDLTVRLPNCPKKISEAESKDTFCEKKTLFSVNLDKDIKMMIGDGENAKVFHPNDFKKTTSIKLSPELAVSVRYPSYSDLDAIKTTGEKTVSDVGFDLLARCTVSFSDKESTYPTSNVPLEDVVTFYKSMTRIEIEKVEEFFKNIPYLLVKTKATCKECGHQVEQKFTGISDFFI